MMKYLLVLVSLLTAASASASSLSVVAAGDFSHPYDGGSNIYQPQLGFPGGGFLWETGEYRTGIELGAFYLTRAWNDPVSSGVKAHAVQASLLGKYHLARWLSMGAGGFYSKTLGNMTDAAGDTFTAADYGVKSPDYGVAGAVDIRFPLAMSTSLILSGRYNYGVANSYRDILALVGLRFFLGR